MTAGERFTENTGRAAALTRWAHVEDPQAATEPARRGFLARFERQVDPDNQLDPVEREKRARRLMRAHMIQLAQKRRAKRAAEQLKARP